MKKQILGLLLISVFQAILVAQQETSFWYFGQNAGLQFDANTNSVTPLTDGALNTNEGCATISDGNGQLLFYTDGRFVYDRNNNIMPNGSGLYGDPSSTQSALIVPKPQDDNLYYIFTVDTRVQENDPDFGFNYSEVDMSLNNGLGDVVTKNVNLLQDSSEKISAVLKDCQSEHVYVITLANLNGTGSSGSFNSFTHFHVFEVTDTDITPLNPQPIGTVVSDPRGYLKFSPDGTKLVSANVSDGLYLYDFDVDTGLISNPILITSPLFNIRSSYGVEFSQNNQFLYVNFSNDFSGEGASIPSNHSTLLVQYNLNALAENNFEPLIISQETSNYRGALQLALDGKIYRAMSSTYFFGKPYLSVINNPNLLGEACNYNAIGISLAPNNSYQGLPPFIQSIFNSQIDIIRNNISAVELDLCSGENYTLQADIIPNADYIWTKDGVVLTQDSANNPLNDSSSELLVDTSGFYEVYIEPNNGECPIEGSAVVSISDFPIAHKPTNEVLCDPNANDGFAFFDFTLKNNEVLLDQDPSVYRVRYFTDLNDANAGENAIDFPFTNTANPQTIYVRAENSNNPNCYDISDFEISVANTPLISEVNTIEFCDQEGDITDGFATLDLEDLIPNIIGNQDDNEVYISFHLSQEDADNKVNELPLTAYTNNNAFNETIFIRIENTLFTDCYRTGSFNLIVNPSPQANDITFFQCDEDGIPDGFTLFNLNEAIENIAGNNSENISVAFFLSQENADNNLNPIVVPDSFNNFTNSQTLYTRVINNNTGCLNFSEVVLDISTTSTRDASISVCDDDGLEDGFTNVNLNLINSIVLGGAPVGSGVIYYETYQDALLETNAVDSNYTNSTAYNQTIYARVENENLCYGISEVELTIFELPNIETEFETLYCLNTFPETITLDAGVNDILPNNYEFLWSTGEKTNSIDINQVGTYTVTVTNANGCSKNRTITVLPSNIATVEAVEVTDLTERNTITVLVSGEGRYEFALNNSLGPYQDSNTFENLNPGFYTIYVRDKNNCGITDKLVSVVGFPKFFTPNGDATNPFWNIKGLSPQFQPNSKVVIFDRYGKIITKLTPLESGWDGTYNGQKMPSSDYWFTVTLEDGRVFSSHFSLRR